jgi:hypothetical protein
VPRLAPCHRSISAIISIPRPVPALLFSHVRAIAAVTSPPSPDPSLGGRADALRVLSAAASAWPVEAG